MTDDAGQTHAAISSKTEILKRGPLLVEIRYSGTLPIDPGYSTPFVMTVSMPNSKTMVNISATVEDPRKRLREISFGTPFAFGPLPWVWDFGTKNWTYGSFRNATDSVTLIQDAGGWKVISGPKGKEQPYETSRGTADAVRWGHIQDGKEVVAFGGATSFTLDGSGQVMFRSALPELTVFEHFVNTPVQFGAATSPSALLSPLIVEVVP